MTCTSFLGREKRSPYFLFIERNLLPHINAVGIHDNVTLPGLAVNFLKHHGWKAFTLNQILQYLTGTYTW